MVNPYNLSNDIQPEVPPSPVLESAREFARWLLKHRTDNYRAKRMFEQKGYRGEILEAVMAEYMELNDAATRRRLQMRRLTGAAIFFGSLAVFAYFLFFAFDHVGVAVYPLLPVAIFGLFRMVMPNMLERV
jgi:hypothetical protein